MPDILGEETITRVRTAVGSRVDGVFVSGASTSTPILGSVQPLSGKDAQTLDVGERSRDWKKVYTRSDLIPVDQGAGAAGDRLTIDGLTYEVRTVARQRSIIPHYRAFVRLVQEGGA